MPNNKELLTELLQDLHQRLVLNYNDGIPFEQLEEDRLAVRNAIDIINKAERVTQNEQKKT